MKKFSERSKRGQRRLVITGGAVCSILLIAAVLVFDKSSLGDLPLHNGDITGTPTAAPTRPEATPSAPAEKPSGTPGPDFPGDVESEEVPDAQDVVAFFTESVLNPVYSYGIVLEQGGTLSSDSLAELAGVRSSGREITLSEVSTGDTGVFGEYVCVCLGTDEDGNALFAYAADYGSTALPDGGIYVGYAMEQQDRLFYGMYPVPCEKYYDCMEGEADNTQLVSKCRNSSMLKDKDTELVYELGRMFSEGGAEKLRSLVPESLLLEKNLRFSKNVTEFFDNFTSLAGMEEMGNEFTLRFKENRNYGRTDYLITELVSLNREDYLRTGGEWGFTVKKDGTLLPFMDFRLADYTGLCFEQTVDVEYAYNGDGTFNGITYKDSESYGSVVVNEDGTSSYIDRDYSVTADSGFILYPEGKKPDSITDLGEGKYLLVAVDGSETVVDLGVYEAYPHMSEETIMTVLEGKLEELNAVAEGIGDE